MAELGRNRYGKAGVRLVKVSRAEEQHDIRDVTVAIALEGDFVDAHVTGDNAHVLPTDTMKNTVYALAKEHFTGSIEEFAILLAAHFMTAGPVSAVRVKMQQHLWSRLNRHSFTKAGSQLRTTRVQRRSTGVTVSSGVRGLDLLKTAQSGFVGYIKDKYTTLPETTDRILATALNAEWTYETAGIDYDAEWQKAMGAIKDVFMTHDSLSVQHTMYAMGEELIGRCASVSRVRFSLPNKHHLLVDLTRFGIDNGNTIFNATREPFGLIEGEIRR